jgi:diacylglycerol kinase family enzyme
MRIFFIINSGGRKPPSSQMVQRLREVLENGAPGSYHIAFSRTLDEAKQLVEQAVQEGYDTLWIGGGDGTVNVLLNYAYGRGLVFGIVPLGTVNALARALRIPLNPVAAVRYLLAATPVDIDVGDVNGHYFLCFASIGFDAAVVHDVPGFTKSRYGRVAYLMSGAKAIMKMDRIQPFEARFDPAEVCGMDPPVETGGIRTERGYSMILSNICNYAGFNFFRRVQPCSGNMELYLFEKNEVLPILGWMARQALGSKKPITAGGVGHFLVPNLHVRADQPLYLQIDGEASVIGDGKEYQITCHPAGAKILVVPEPPGS